MLSNECEEDGYMIENCVRSLFRGPFGNVVCGFVRSIMLLPLGRMHVGCLSLCMSSLKLSIMSARRLSCELDIVSCHNRCLALKSPARISGRF